MAFAQPTGLDDAAFEHRVRAVCAWFEPLDPFENKGAVLEIEKQNFSAAAERRSEARGTVLLRGFGKALRFIQPRPRRRASDP
ncbi:hypothetical protein ACRAWG_24450 [Methylobacterium sp. P31]